jgi:hypothetical protein
MKKEVMEGNYKRQLGDTSWKLEAERAFSLPSAFKIYTNLWEGKNLVILNQY